MFADVKRIWSRFVQVKREASLNHPDTWNSSVGAASQPVAGLAKLSVPAAAQMPDPAHGPDVAIPVVSTGTVAIPTADGQHV